MSRVIIHHRAAKYLKKLSKDEKEKIRQTLRKLENYPGKISGIKYMKGEWEGFRRMRIGVFRVIFWYEEMEDTVYIDHIGPRGDLYKCGVP
ncbi:MAG: type II toxin-antitoxin system RelE/ParE family toxin [Desulfatirhabdiaceae bacterium]